MNENQGRLPVTVVLPVKNEALHLAACLESLRDAFANVIVVDSDSTDATPRIAKAHGAHLLNFRWNGRFPKKRNWVLRTHPFETPWVLFLDADERVTPEFLAELEASVAVTPHVGFWISFDNWFLGRILRHGDVFTKLPLFRVGAGEYERIEWDVTGALDMEVHEHPDLNGSVGHMHSRLMHHDQRSYQDYLTKHAAYAGWEVQRLRHLQQGGAEVWRRLTRRQRFKYRNLGRWWLGWFYFGVSYIPKAGFLDGWAGLRFALAKRSYFASIRREVCNR